MPDKYIPMDECFKGTVYALQSRNLAFGVYDGEQGFVGIRTKFDSRYLFTEFHHDQGPPFGTVRPYLAIETCPVTDLRESLETICSQCQTRVEFREHPDDGVERLGRGEWWHLAETDCPETHPAAPMNQILFDYLTLVEETVDWADDV